MFMKNLSLYRLQRRLGVADLNDFEAALRRRNYRPLTALEHATDGFVQPMPAYRPNHLLLVGRSEQEWLSDEREPDSGFVTREFLFDEFGGPFDALVLMFYREEKVIVSSAIKRELQQRVNEIEKSEARKVYARERADLKQLLISRVLPHAQARYWQAPVFFFSNGLVVVGEVGAKAEMILSELRGILGTLPAVKLQLKDEVPFVLTKVAKAQASGDLDLIEDNLGFSVADDFQMQELHEHPAIARMKNTDVTMEEVQGLLHDKMMTHANVMWQDKVTFKLDPKFAIRKLRVMDSVFETVAGSEEEEEDLAGANYASAMIEQQTFVEMIANLVKLFGGEREPVELDPEAKKPLVLKDIDKQLMLAQRSRAKAAAEPDPEEKEDEE